MGGITRQALSDLEALYGQLAAEMEALNPICESSGRCCRFREYGHRLYLTDLELHYFEYREGPVRVADGGPRQRRLEEGICPFQEERLCTTREGRPLGCRVYYCDPRAEGRIEIWAEEFHGRIRKIHETYGIPYRYRPWLEALGDRDPDFSGSE
ncbi:MAG: hypothetical protein QF752_00030 [Planctomycetota bacterium]|nr:hypothetical protein [Planctomycetota bacterium]